MFELMTRRRNVRVVNLLSLQKSKLRTIPICENPSDNIQNLIFDAYSQQESDSWNSVNIPILLEKPNISDDNKNGIAKNIILIL
jgi:hypothetical protein